MPIFSAVIFGRSIPALTWASAATALAGTALVSFDGAPPNIGDLWSISAAAASAMFILRLEGLAQNCQPRELNSACLWITTLLSGIWLVGSNGLAPFGPSGAGVNPMEGLSGAVAAVDDLCFHSGWAVLYLGLVTTALCNWLQTLGQREVGAEQVRDCRGRWSVVGVVGGGRWSLDLTIAHALQYHLPNSKQHQPAS